MLQCHEQQNFDKFPLSSVTFLANSARLLQSCFKASSPQQLHGAEGVAHCLAGFDWLVAFLLQEAATRWAAEMAAGRSANVARNNLHAFTCKPLVMAYIQRTALARFAQHVSDLDVDQRSLQPVLQRMAALFGLWTLQDNLAVFYRGGYFRSVPNAAELLQEASLQLCAALRDEAVALVDAFAIPDFILNSAIGAADGRIYERLQMAMMEAPAAFERVDWWTEFARKPVIGSLKPKL